MNQSVIKRTLFVIFLLSLVSCSTSHNHTLVSSYSLSKQPYTDVGYSKGVWEILPLIELDNGVSIRINSLSWKSFTYDEQYCSTEFSEFTFMLWSQKKLVFDVKNSYFVSSTNDKIFIESVKVAEKDEYLYLKHLGSGGIKLEPSSLSSSQLHSLWKSNGYEQMRSDRGTRYLEVKTKVNVGCPSDNYSLYIQFMDSKGNLKAGYWLYFYPVEFRSFNR